MVTLRGIEREAMEPPPGTGQMMSLSGEGLHSICQDLRELQAICADQSAEIASLRNDCTHYRKRFAEAVQNCATSQQHLAEASKNEAALEQRRQNAETYVTQLRNALSQVRDRLEEAELSKTTVQNRSQQLEQKLEQYIKREAEKHREVIQTVDKRMKIAMLRLAQYRQQRHRLICETRRMHQKIEQLNKHLLQKTQEADALRCIAESRESELHQARLRHEKEKAQFDALWHHNEQETLDAKVQCGQKEEELLALRRSLNILRNQLDQKAEESETAGSAKRQKEYELLEANKLCEQQRAHYETLLRQREEALQLSRLTAAVKSEELQRKQELIERQKLDYEQQRMKFQQDVEMLAYTIEAKETDVIHLMGLLSQQKKDFEAMAHQRDRESIQKDNDLRRATDTIRQKQEALETALEECGRKAQAHEELRQAISDVRRRCDTLAVENQKQLRALENDFRRRLETKLKECQAQKEMELTRREEDVSEEMKRVEAIAIEFERRKAAAELQHVQTMVMTMTDQNKGLVKQCKVLASKLEESTASVEKLKKLLELEKCKLLVSAKKASEAPLLRQRLAALERSISVQKQQAHKLLVERDDLHSHNENLLCELDSLRERCKDLTGDAARSEGRAQDMETKLLQIEQIHREKESEIALMKEDIASRILETSTYKDNLKHIWTCIVEVLPVNAEAQAEVCVSQRMTPETVRRVHRLLREAAQTLCFRAVKHVGNLAQMKIARHLDVCTSNSISEREARVLLEERLCFKERELAELETRMAAVNDKLLAAERALHLQEISNSQAQCQVLSLEDALKKAAETRKTMENDLLLCEEKFAAASTQRNELQLELKVKEQNLAGICKAKNNVDEQLRERRKEEVLLNEERRRSEEERVQLKQRLMQEKCRTEELEALVQKLQKNCHGTKKECGVLLEANKANCERMLDQAAREYEKKIQQLRALHQQELDTHEEAYRQKERCIIELLISEAANREAALHAEIEGTRRESDYRLGILRARLLREENKQEEAKHTFHRGKMERRSLMSGCNSPCVAIACVSSRRPPPQREYASACSTCLPSDINGTPRTLLKLGEANVSKAATLNIDRERRSCLLERSTKEGNESPAYAVAKSCSLASPPCNQILPCKYGFVGESSRFRYKLTSAVLIALALEPRDLKSFLQHIFHLPSHADSPQTWQGLHWAAVGVCSTGASRFPCSAVVQEMSYITSADVWRITASGVAARLLTSKKYNLGIREPKSSQAQQDEAAIFMLDPRGVNDDKFSDVSARPKKQQAFPATAFDAEQTYDAPRSCVGASTPTDTRMGCTLNSTACTVDHYICNAMVGTSVISGVIHSKEPGVNWLEGDATGTTSASGNRENALDKAAFAIEQGESANTSGAGFWEDNCKSGWGVQQYDQGCYEGQWRDGRQHGYGRFTLTDQTVQYTGEWRKGVPHGWGLQIWNNYLTEEGYDSGDDLLGNQVQLNHYEGQYENGLRHGYGVFWYANGCCYEGQWQSNRKHGRSIFTTENRYCYNCVFDNDKLVSSILDIAVCGAEPTSAVGISCDELSGGQATSKTLFQDTDQTLTNLNSVLTLELCRKVALPRTGLTRTTMAAKSAQLEAQKSINAAHKWLLRNLRILRRMYSLYRKLASFEEQDPSTMSFLQFWVLAADAHLLSIDWPLSKINRTLRVSTTTDLPQERVDRGMMLCSSRSSPRLAAEQFSWRKVTGRTEGIESLHTGTGEQSINDIQTSEVFDMHGVPSDSKSSHDIRENETVPTQYLIDTEEALQHERLTGSLKTKSEGSASGFTARKWDVHQKTCGSNFILEMLSRGLKNISNLNVNGDCTLCASASVSRLATDNDVVEAVVESSIKGSPAAYSSLRRGRYIDYSGSCLAEKRPLLFPSFLRALVLMAQQQSLEQSISPRSLEHCLAKFMSLLLQFYETCNTTAAASGSRKSSNTCCNGKRGSRRSSLSQKMRCPSTQVADLANCEAGCISLRSSLLLLEMWGLLLTPEAKTAASFAVPEKLSTCGEAATDRYVWRLLHLMCFTSEYVFSRFCTPAFSNNSESLTHRAILINPSPCEIPRWTVENSSSDVVVEPGEWELPARSRRFSKQTEPPSVLSNGTSSGHITRSAESLLKGATGGKSASTLKGVEPQAPTVVQDEPEEPSEMPQGMVDESHTCAEEQATFDAAHEFNELPLGLSPLEVIYILLELVPEFHNQEEAMHSIYDKLKNTESDKMLRSPGPAAAEETSSSAPSSVRNSVEGCVPPEKDIVVSAGAFGHAGNNSQEMKCRGNSVKPVPSKHGPPSANKRRDSNAFGRRESRRGNDRGKDHARVRIVSELNAHADASEQQEETRGSVPTQSADPGASPALAEAETGSQQQQQQQQHGESSAAVKPELRARPFADVRMQRCYARLVRKILGKTKSSWIDLANRDVTAFELKLILLRMVEYKTPSSLAARLSLPARLSLLVSRLVKHPEAAPCTCVPVTDGVDYEARSLAGGQSASRNGTLCSSVSATSTRNLSTSQSTKTQRSAETACNEVACPGWTAPFWKGFHVPSHTCNSPFADAQLCFLPFEDDVSEEGSGVGLLETPREEEAETGEDRGDAIPETAARTA